jgi:hypothetical protein
MNTIHRYRFETPAYAMEIEALSNEHAQMLFLEHMLSDMENDAEKFGLTVDEFWGRTSITQLS